MVVCQRIEHKFKNSWSFRRPAVTALKRDIDGNTDCVVKILWISIFRKHNYDLSNKIHGNPFSILLNCQKMNFKDSFWIVGVDLKISSGTVVLWTALCLVKTTLWFLYFKYFSPNNLATIYSTLTRRKLGYYSHIWGASFQITMSLLDSLQNVDVHLVDHLIIPSSIFQIFSKFPFRRLLFDNTLAWHTT